MALKTAKYYEKDSEKAVKCLLCPNECTIGEGKSGRCFARKNIGGELTAEGYGRITSIALDPIEKKPLAMFHPGSYILSIGFYGCNFTCKFCQNYRISQCKADYREFTPKQIVELALEAQSAGNIGIAYTYNEPLTSFEFVYDCAKLAKEAGLKNVIVTNGYINREPMAELLPYIDAMNIDLKAFTDKFYRELCGGSVEPVKQTIALCAKSCHVEVTTLLIPGFNDTNEEIESIASFLAHISPDIPLHLTRHHPDYKLLEQAPIRRERLFELMDVARRHLKYVFAGNI
ncbi:AmmeMemoRadiSam system radical SAM enzyme [[Clostridium] cellulosi]